MSAIEPYENGGCAVRTHCAEDCGSATRFDPESFAEAVDRTTQASIDFDFYRRRAAYERRIAQQAWLKNTLRGLTHFARVALTSIRQRASDRTAIVSRCCLAAERAVCCA